MGYTILIVVCLLVAALIAFLAARLLISMRWVVGFVQGCFGLGLLALAAGIGICANDLSSYHPLASADEPVANISFVKRDEQRFMVTVVDRAGHNLQVEVHGDMWQANIRMVDWSRYLKLAGVKPGYRIDQVKGRFYALEQQRKAQHDDTPMIDSRFGIDLWKGIYENSLFIPGVEASYRNTTFLPMADGALFEVKLATDGGLLAKPLNEPAQRAVSEWQ
jgi:hypothetical protein